MTKSSLDQDEDNAIKAYLEWMPIRENKSKLKIWRKFEVVNLFQLLMLDTRSIYRPQQLNIEDYFEAIQ